MKGFGFLNDLESIGWDGCFRKGSTYGQRPLSNGVEMKENWVVTITVRPQ